MSSSICEDKIKRKEKGREGHKRKKARCLASLCSRPFTYSTFRTQESKKEEESHEEEVGRSEMKNCGDCRGLVRPEHRFFHHQEAKQSEQTWKLRITAKRILQNKRRLRHRLPLCHPLTSSVRASDLVSKCGHQSLIEPICPDCNVISIQDCCTRWRQAFLSIEGRIGQKFNQALAQKDYSRTTGRRLRGEFNSKPQEVCVGQKRQFVKTAVLPVLPATFPKAPLGQKRSEPSASNAPVLHSGLSKKAPVANFSAGNLTLKSLFASLASSYKTAVAGAGDA